MKYPKYIKIENNTYGIHYIGKAVKTKILSRKILSRSSVLLTIDFIGWITVKMVWPPGSFPGGCTCLNCSSIMAATEEEYNVAVVIES